MPDDPDYPDDLSDSLLDTDPAEVVASQMHEREPSTEVPSAHQPRPRPHSDKRRKLVIVGLTIGVAVIAVLAYSLMHRTAPPPAPTPPALARIQHLAAHPLAPPVHAAPPATVVAPRQAPALPKPAAQTQPVVATVPARPAPAATTPATPAPVAAASVSTITVHTIVPAVPVTPVKAPAPPATRAIPDQLKTLRGQLEQAQAKLKAEHAKYLHQLHIGRREYAQLQHAVPGATRVTAVLRDGVVLTAPDGKVRVVRQGATLQ